MKSYFLLLRLNLRNLLAGFRGAMRKPNGKIDISRLILYPLSCCFSSFSSFQIGLIRRLCF